MATDWLDLSQQAFEASTTYMDANYRSDWEYSLRAFRSEHAAGSKYLSDEYKARSRLFRPKTRSIIRKNEAAGAVALFSNMEVVDLSAGNPDDLQSLASRDCMKAILEYRLGKTIPTFQICMGGIQDAQTQGVVVSYQYWEYEMRDGRKIKDKPCIELRPIENIRLDGGASWVDPVGTSPYFCDIIPMYVCDVRAMMKNKDEKTGAPKWKKFDDSIIEQARPEAMDTTRKARFGKQQDPHDESSGIKAFDIVWVMRWFMRDSQGEDNTFYTLGTKELLTKAQPLEEVYFHGRRPYVMGYSILETHKAIKSSLPTITKQLQQETNDIGNQRIDNVKFVLNKRWLVARGRQTDVQSLVRNVPGGVTLTTDPKTDIQESNWPDVTSSAYVEQDRLNADFDELAGNFSPSTKVANNAVNDTLGGSRMAAQGAGLMTDYLLRTIIETWWEPVLRQLILLEQHYETDEIVLALCAQKARLFPRYGLSQITDGLLMKEVNLTVNVGMGSSNPQQRMQNFVVASNAVMGLVANAPPSMNIQEMSKEIWSNAGYRDGARFMSEQQDPRLMKAMQIIQQLQGTLNGKQMDLRAAAQVEQLKLTSNEKIKGAEIQVNNSRIAGDLRIREVELHLEAQRIELERMKLAIDAQGSSNAQQDEIKALQGAIEDSAQQLLLDKERIKATAEMDAQKLSSDIDSAVAEVQRIADNFIAKTTAMHEVASAKMKASAEKAGAEKEQQAAAKVNDGHAQSIIAMQNQMVELAQAIKDSMKAKKKVSITFADGRKASAESQAA